MVQNPHEWDTGISRLQQQGNCYIVPLEGLCLSLLLDDHTVVETATADDALFQAHVEIRLDAGSAVCLPCCACHLYQRLVLSDARLSKRAQGQGLVHGIYVHLSC